MKITLNISLKKVVLPGRVKCGGTEEEIVVAHGCQKRKKLICGPEGELVVAHGRLPSPALPAGKILDKYLCSDLEILHCKNVSLSYQIYFFLQ